MWLERLAAAPELSQHRIAVRAEQPADAGFLEKLYGSTREDELAPVPWPEAAKRAFIAQQFAAQAASYRANYAGAEFLVVTLGGVDAGRLYVHERTDEIRLMDIALLPEFRRRRIGTALLGVILNEGARLAKRVTIHVESFNPARRLYERLDFHETSLTDDPVYRLFEWRPPLTPAG